jgi:uncharacterized protein
MDVLLQGLPLSSFLLVLFSGLLVGMAKTGIPGVGLAVVPLMAYVFGGKASTGYLLPMLIMADVFAVWYYNRHAQWKLVWQLLPWAMLGILLGTFTGKYISEKAFGQILSIVVLVGIVLMVFQEVKKKNIKVPDSWWFAGIMGLAGGFATMMGNAAGPIMVLYLLAMRLPKNKFIGTGAWFFLIVNVSKVPLHIWVWHTINTKTMLMDIAVFPAILLGVFIGIKVVKKINEKWFRILIILTTLVTTALIFYKTFL